MGQGNNKREEILKKKHLQVLECEYKSNATSRGSPMDVSFSSYTAARPAGAKKKSVFVVKRSIKELTIPEEPNLNTERRAAVKRKSLAPEEYILKKEVEAPYSSRRQTAELKK